jgi:hypothetical protein
MAKTSKHSKSSRAPPNAGLSYSCIKCFLSDGDVSASNANRCNGCKLLREAIQYCEKIIGQDEVITEVKFIRPDRHSHPSQCLLRGERKGRNTTHTLVLGFQERLSGDGPCGKSLIGTYGQFTEVFPFALARKWIKHCSTSHGECQRPQRGPLPRRVIDVGNLESSEPYVYETRREVDRYATMSHCWEDSLPMKTTKSNLINRQGRLVWEELPVAFRECITIVRLLGIRYLWIDSLCIVQDDHIEWAIESARMANIFENSSVTIAIHQSSPSSPSIIDFNRFFVLPYQYYDTEAGRNLTKKVNFYLKITGIESDLPASIENTKLSSRGWVFQVSPAFRA